MSFFRPFFALCALSLFTSAAQAEPAVSTVVAFFVSNPVGNLVRGPDGALYGVTSSASVSGGLVYRTTVDGSDVRTLYQLRTQDGVTPQAGLLLGSDGRLYGTTQFGRGSESTGSGTLYAIKLDGTDFTILHRFAAWTGKNIFNSPINTNGAYPVAELVQGSDGYLYGTTQAGGTYGTGTIFKISADGTGFQTLHIFAPITSTVASGLVVTADGASPTGRLLEGADGYFYGTAPTGGTNGRGTLFRIRFDGTGFEVLHQFSAATIDTSTGLPENADGTVPFAGLTDGNDGFFYGVANGGGINGRGTIFALTPDGTTFNVLHTFDATKGAEPTGELLLGSDGKLYGTTRTGGVNSSNEATIFGTLFSIARDGTGHTVLHNFDGSKGGAPISQLVQLGSDVFVGINAFYGNCNTGTIYRYSGAGDTVAGNTGCNQRRNNNSGGGSSGPGLLLLLGGLAWMRRRLH